ncbi:integral membrane protein [Fructobacillus ficulneus]|uniref:Integral membrane protein n=2 Tax=Fructobacillus ficulneus TaxID=157463 RepID=A0A0K8MFP4_9LACO|nr:integral membrane protein [Fructobacillus ficulneus]
MSLTELLKQWKAVVIALAGVAGTITLTVLVGSLFFNTKSVLAAIPPLTGGLVSATLMVSGLKAQGLTAYLALPVTMFVTHSIFGYPLTSALLKSEGRRLLKGFDKETAENPDLVKNNTATAAKPKKQLIPEAYNTSAFIITKVAAVAVLAQLFNTWTNSFVNVNVVYLIFGVIAHQVGFLDDKALEKAGVSNWLMYGLIAFVFSQLSVVTPNGILSILLEIVVLIALGMLGMFIVSFVLAKPFGMSWQMAFACALTALFGFPADYIMTSEVAHTVASNKEEENFLLNHMMPKMLVGGFATVSVASVIIASYFIKLI